MTQARLAALHNAASRNSFWRFLGIELAEAGDGWARLRLRVRDEICQAPGAVVHGGVYPALVDAAVGSALMTVGEGSEGRVGQATVDLNVSLLRPVTSGYLHAEGRVLRRGRAVGFGDVTITDDKGQLVAVGRATYLFPRRGE